MFALKSLWVLMLLLVGCMAAPTEQSREADVGADADIWQDVDMPIVTEPPHEWSSVRHHQLIPENYVCNGIDPEMRTLISDLPFSKPVRDRDSFGPVNREYLVYGGGGGLSRSGATVSSTGGYGARLLPNALWAYRGEDVILYYGIMARDPEPELQAHIAVYLDYEEVDIIIRVWNPERDEILHEVTGAHVLLDGIEDYTPMDFLVPAHLFERDGVHDLSYMVRVVNPVDAMERMNDSRRHTIFYNSFDNPSRPCIPRAQPFPRSEWEREQFLVWDIFYYDPHQAATNPAYDRRQPIRVMPGEIVETVFLINSSGHSGDIPYLTARAYAPTFAGTPLREPFLYQIPRPARGELAAIERGTFQITIPDKAGEHVMMGGTWDYPFLPTELPDGSDTAFPNRNFFMTNFKRYVVEDPEPDE